MWYNINVKYRKKQFNMYKPMQSGIAYPRGRTAFDSRTVPDYVGFFME